MRTLAKALEISRPLLWLNTSMPVLWGAVGLRGELVQRAHRQRWRGEQAGGPVRRRCMGNRPANERPQGAAIVVVSTATLALGQQINLDAAKKEGKDWLEYFNTKSLVPPPHARIWD